MRIAELYQSIQGEGLLTGTPSIFLRTSGCNLRCEFCDTPYTSWQPEGQDLELAEILERLAAYPAQHTVITGGEPMLHAELLPLCDALRRRGQHITIETAGTLYLPVACDLMSISPKLSNSTPSTALAGAWRERHERTRWQPQVLQALMRDYAYQLKFVIDHPDDCREVEAALAELPTAEPRHVWLMPQGTEPETLSRTAAWLEPLCRERGWNYCPRRHIEWFGFTRGT